jgi:uncharacterized protein YbjT (DUF2867 family)
MDVQLGLAIGAWHERGEAAVRASGIPYTFVQPSGLMSNLLAPNHNPLSHGFDLIYKLGAPCALADLASRNSSFSKLCRAMRSVLRRFRAQNGAPS